MKLISPVDHLAEVAPLLEAGASELYGGWVPEEWRRGFNLLASPNQRTFAGAQIDSLEELAAIVDRAHRGGATFSLTLNAPFFSDAQVPLLLDYVERCAAAGVDGIILADLGLLRLLRPRFPRIELHASTLAHLGNSAALRMYARQGIDRVVLPRHLTVGEMCNIVEKTPEVRCDAFLLVGKCPNNEGLCSHHHADPDKIWPCEIPYRIEPLDAPADPRLETAMARQGSWAKSDRRHGCGLCAIPSLLRVGISGCKLVGRGAPTMQKVSNLLLAGEFLRLAQTSPDFPVYRRVARAAYRRRFGTTCSPNVCYYPEFYEAE